MQLTFTVRILFFNRLKFLALSLMLTLCTQISFSQNTVCTTVTGDLQAGDLTINTRPFRDNVLPTGCTNKTLCLSGFSEPGCYYDVITFTNPIASLQCITLTYTLNSISGGNPANPGHNQTFVTVYQGTFNPANLCTNRISDPGTSVFAGIPQTWVFSLAASATARIVVTSQEAITTANYTLEISTGVCTGCTATVSPANGSICVGGTTSFTVSATGTVTTTQWQVSTDGGATYNNISNGGVYSGATTATLTITGATAGMNNYRYRANLTCGGTPVTSTSATLTIGPLPVVTVSASPYTSVSPGLSTWITAASTPAGLSYAWTFNGAPLAGATTSSILRNVDGIGDYTVRVTFPNGCVNTASFKLEARYDDRIFIYPNPAPNGRFQIRVYSGTIYDYRTISIYNAIGQRVYKRELATIGPWQRMDVNLAGIGAGVYMVEVSDVNDTKKVIGKMIIQR